MYLRSSRPSRLYSSSRLPPFVGLLSVLGSPWPLQASCDHRVLLAPPGPTAQATRSPRCPGPPLRLTLLDSPKPLLGFRVHPSNDLLATPQNPDICRQLAPDTSKPYRKPPRH